MEAAGTLRRARRASRLSQRALAALTGIDQAQIARIETGRVQPRIDTLTHLLDACGYEMGVTPVPPIDPADRRQVRELLGLSDIDREAFFIESNRKMLAMFDAAKV